MVTDLSATFDGGAGGHHAADSSDRLAVSALPRLLAAVYFFVVYRAVRRGSLPAPPASCGVREGTLEVPAPQAG